MHERHTSALGGLGDDLVAEDIAGVGGVELLDVRAAEPAGEHAHELPRPLGLGHVRERRLSVLPDDHGAHGRIVGREERSRMAVKLHRCPLLWAKASGHPCWRVQKALDDMGVEYEIVKEPWPLRGRRKDLIAATGQSSLPAIELEDGSWYREQSAEMEREIRAGRLGSPG